MQRTLKNRHIQMIALGSAIGTGLFFGSKDTIAMTGPSVLLSYAVCGVFMYYIVRALAEMSVQNPVSGSFSAYAYDYWGPAAGFITGWNYWFNYVIVSMAELIAFGIYINYWFPIVPEWLSALACAVLLTVVNLINVKTFGETEYWLSGVKVAAIISMIGFGGYLIFFGSGFTASVAHLSAHGGFYPHGLSGFLMSMTVVMFSFGGTELIGITAGEAANPAKTIPKAVNSIIARILIFYIGSTAIILMLYPWNAMSSLNSPYVEVFSDIGISAAANILNFIIVTAALSAYNSALYANGRMLFNLAEHGSAPKVFAKLNSRSIPRNAILFSALISLAAVFLLYLAPKAAFMYVVAVATAAALINWFMILITHAHFRKLVAVGKQSASTFTLPFYPYISYLCYLFLVAVFVIMWFTPGMSETAFIAPLWLLLLFIAYSIKTKKGGGTQRF
ncbi:MAG: amino acid permease [Bacillota bacterium]